MITPTILDKLGWQAYFIFMCTNLAFVPLVYFCYPETSGLTLEEIDYLFTKDGRSGVQALTGPSQPVQESIKEQKLMREGLKGDDIEKRAESASAEHIEIPEEIKDEKDSQ